MIKFLLLSFGSIFLLACQPSIPPSAQDHPRQEIADYYIRLLQDGQKVWAQAEFHQIDSLNNIQPKRYEKVELNQKIMQMENLGIKGLRYTLAEKIPFNNHFTFTLTNDQNRQFHHHLTMSPINNFLIKGGKVKKSRGFTVVYEGEALQKDESIILFLQDQKQKSLSTVFNSKLQDIQLSVLPSQLLKINEGNGHLYLVKKRINKVVKPDTTINFRIEYFTKPMKIEIVD